MRKLLISLPIALVFSIWTAMPLLAQPQGKKILLEKITSAGCPSCPWGDNLIEGYLGADTNLVPVAIHVNNAGHVDHMACADGDSILADYLWAHPTLMVDRYKWPAYPHTAMSSSFWTTMINERKQMPMIATIGGSTSYQSGTRMLDISLQGTILWDLSWDLRVNAYLVEDEVTGTGLGYDQLNGYNNSPGHPLYGLGDPIVGYVHHWVLRDMLGGHQGTAIFPNPVPSGHAYNHSFQIQLDSAFDASKCTVILVVQRHHADLAQREVLNVVQLGLNESIAASIGTPEPYKGVQVWPNPSKGSFELDLPEQGKWEVSILNLQGRLIQAQAGSGSRMAITMPEVGAGIYLLRGQSSEGRSFTKRIEIQ